MIRSSHLKTLFPFAAATLLAACATAPSAEERAYEQAVKSMELMPASVDDRIEIKKQDPLAQASFWGIEYEKNPADIEAAREFAKILRVIGSEKRAAEIASQTLALAPNDPQLLSLLGKSMLSSGDPGGAVDILRRAIQASPNDATLYGALGVAYDQTGRHREAQSVYRQALRIEPNRASLLSNLGLSLALTGEPENAESLLRRATSLPEAGPRERQNLALVLSLQGKFDEAKSVGASDLPDTMVDDNIDYFRAMLTTKRRNWGQLRGSLE